MGLLETIDHKLTLICLALNIALDTDAPAAVLQQAAKFEPVPGIAATTPEAVTAAVLGTSTPAPTAAVVPPAPAGTVRVTVKQALAVGAKLTGQEIDEQGCYWDKGINTNVPAVTQKNIWKRGKNIDDAVYDNRIAQIKADVAGSAPAPQVAPAPAATLPLPGVAPATTLPLPAVGAVHQSSLEDPVRKEIIALINLLTNKYEVDYSVIGVMLAENGAKDSNFVTLPDAAYPVVAKKLNQWTQAYDLVDEADQAVRGMNGNDPTYLLTLMGQLQLGTNELSTVQYGDYYRLYQNIHAYQNQLEAHFQKPLTAIKPDPFKA